MENKILTLNLKPVGDRCNLSCKYCYEARRRSSVLLDIPFYHLKLEEIGENYNFVHVVFHGGEPLLTIDNMLRSLVIFTKKILDNRCDFQIQTNGILLTENRIEFFKKLNCRISVSLDPLEGNLRCNLEQQNLVEYNIRMAVRHRCYPGVITVVHSMNCDFLTSFLNELVNMHIPYWTINKINVSRNSEYYISEEKYLSVLLEILQYWIEKELYHSISIHPLTDLISTDLNHSCHFCSEENKCSLFCTISGKSIFYGCEHYSKKDGYWYADCTKCSFFVQCGGGCPMDVKNEEYCNARRHFFQEIEKIRSIVRKANEN